MSTPSHVALIKNGVVENVAVVETGTEQGKAYLDAIKSDYDHVVNLDDHTDPESGYQPWIGWSHHPRKKVKFEAPDIPEPESVADEEPPA